MEIEEVPETAMLGILSSQDPVGALVDVEEGQYNVRVSQLGYHLHFLGPVSSFIKLLQSHQLSHVST